jgi:hypothetical protein
VRRTLAELDSAHRKSREVDPAAGIDALLAGKRVERRLAAVEGRASWPLPVDLVSDALDLLMRKL